MAIDIIYVDDGKGVILRACDEVNGKEVIEAHIKVYNQHKIVQQDYHIMNNSLCSEYNVTSNEIEIISNIDRKMAKINPDIIKAIVESSILEFTLTDVWQAYVEDCIKHSKSFINQNDALVWIRKILYGNNK